MFFSYELITDLFPIVINCKDGFFLLCPAFPFYSILQICFIQHFSVQTLMILIGYIMLGRIQMFCWTVYARKYHTW